MVNVSDCTNVDVWFGAFKFFLSHRSIPLYSVLFQGPTDVSPLLKASHPIHMANFCRWPRIINPISPESTFLPLLLQITANNSLYDS
jgi:hypothetical protein